jgi:radical SAM superfamily enzyme YgiQ (UPF0313 family)
MQPPVAQDALRQPGAILLVSCYELGHQPLGIALPRAFLTRAGYDPAMADLAVEPLDVAQLRAARLVAISVPMHTALRLGMRVAHRVREVNPTARIIFHGLYAPLHEGVLMGALADAVFGGECEAALVEWVQAWEKSGLGEPPHLTRVTLQKLAFPVPQRTGLPPLARYAQLETGGARRLAGYTETSRGCLHHCRHCPIPAVYGGRFFIVPGDVVLADVRNQVEAGATHITFGDADFLNGPGHALRVARAVHAAFPRLTFDFTAKVEHLLLHHAQFSELAALGAVFAVTAVESLNNGVLAHLQKGHTRADAVEALRLLRVAHIAPRPTFVPFTPWADLDDYFDLLDWIESEDLGDAVDPVQLSVRLLVPPSSLLLGNPAMQPYLGALDEEALTHTWTHPDPRMDVLQREAARVAEHAAGHHEDARVTFRRLRALATAVRYGRWSVAAATLDAHAAAATVATAHAKRAPTPRLTESWFC